MYFSPAGDVKPVLYLPAKPLAKSYAFLSIDSIYFSISLDLALIDLSVFVVKKKEFAEFLPTSLKKDKTLSNFFKLLCSGSSDVNSNILQFL